MIVGCGEKSHLNRDYPNNPEDIAMAMDTVNRVIVIITKNLGKVIFKVSISRVNIRSHKYKH